MLVIDTDCRGRCNSDSHTITKRPWHWHVQHWADPVLLTFHSALRKLNTEPSIGASHQISAHFGKAVLWELLIPFWSVNKHGGHRQFFLLIGRFLKQLFLWNRLAKWYEAMFVNGSGRNEQSHQRTFHRCFLLSFGSFGQTVSEEKNLKNQAIRNKNCLWQIFSSATALPNEPKLGRKHLWKVLYKDC
jgi:hypothetical protein